MRYDINGAIIFNVANEVMFIYNILALLHDFGFCVGKQVLIKTL